MGCAGSKAKGAGGSKPPQKKRSGHFKMDDDGHDGHYDGDNDHGNDY